jgi:hypothetical protein
VAVGVYAGRTSQGAEAVAIGGGAGLNNIVEDTFVVKPVRNTSGTTVLQYDSTTGEITHSTLTALTVVGDDSTGTTFNTGETFKIAGAGSVTTAVSGDTITITGTDTDTTYTAGTGLQLIGSAFSVDATVARTSANITIVGDDSTGTAITLNETFKIAGGTNITTAVSGDTLTITGPDLSNYLQNTGTQTIDNLTFNDNIIGTASNADLNFRYRRHGQSENCNRHNQFGQSGRCNQSRGFCRGHWLFCR